jgi:hypothetical protein
VAAEVRSKKEPDTTEHVVLSRWVDRVGAALAAPRLALASSDSAAGRGRASSDITLLLFLALFVRETHIFASSGWMIVDGDWAGAFMVLVAGLQRYLLVAVVLLIVGTLALWILAGRRRSMADDFDLLCVSLTPLVVLELANALLYKVGLDIHPVGIVVGYGWFGVLWVLSLLQARSRDEAAP